MAPLVLLFPRAGAPKAANSHPKMSLQIPQCYPASDINHQYKEGRDQESGSRPRLPLAKKINAEGENIDPLEQAKAPNDRRAYDRQADGNRPIFDSCMGQAGTDGVGEIRQAGADENTDVEVPASGLRRDLISAHESPPGAGVSQRFWALYHAGPQLLLKCRLVGGYRAIRVVRSEIICFVKGAGKRKPGGWQALWRVAKARISCTVM